MHRRLLVLFVFLAWASQQAPGRAAGAQPSSPFMEGVALYQRGEYEKAQAQFLAQLQQGPPTAALYYNLGNTALKLRQIGWAILYYERARLYMPRDDDLHANLAAALASRRTPPVTEPPGWLSYIWQELRQKFTLNELTGAAVMLLWLGTGLLVWRLRSQQFRRRHLWLLWSTWALFLFVALLAADKWRTDWRANRAVIVADAPLYAGPAETFQILRNVYQGEFAYVQREEGLWREIITENGSRGWLAASAVALIAPPTTARKPMTISSQGASSSPKKN